jgi:hypothetical protein
LIPIPKKDVEAMASHAKFGLEIGIFYPEQDVKGKLYQCNTLGKKVLNLSRRCEVWEFRVQLRVGNASLTHK